MGELVTSGVLLGLRTITTSLWALQVTKADVEGRICGDQLDHDLTDSSYIRRAMTVADPTGVIPGRARDLWAPPYTRRIRPTRSRVPAGGSRRAGCPGATPGWRW